MNTLKGTSKKIFFIFCMILILGSLSAKNFNINGSEGEYFFVNGTSGNVGIGIIIAKEEYS